MKIYTVQAKFNPNDTTQQIVQQRSEFIASILEQAQAPLLAWAFFDTLPGACWSIEDNTDWQYAMACAEIFDIMVK